jgi:hypothetical protein
MILTRKRRVLRVLLRAVIHEVARPKNICSDNSFEFTAETVQRFLADQSSKQSTSTPATPVRTR